jgi:hypothetical protein
MLSNFGACVVALSLLFAGTASAAENANRGALAQGTPAGVKQAQSWQGHHQLLWLIGGGIVVGGIVLVATGNGHGAIGTTCPLPGCTATATTSTATTTTSTGTH